MSARSRILIGSTVIITVGLLFGFLLGRGSSSSTPTPRVEQTSSKRSRDRRPQPQVEETTADAVSPADLSCRAPESISYSDLCTEGTNLIKSACKKGVFHACYWIHRQARAFADVDALGTMISMCEKSPKPLNLCSNVLRQAKSRDELLSLTSTFLSQCRGGDDQACKWMTHAVQISSSQLRTEQEIQDLFRSSCLKGKAEACIELIGNSFKDAAVTNQVYALCEANDAEACGGAIWALASDNNEDKLKRLLNKLHQLCDGGSGLACVRITQASNHHVSFSYVDKSQLDAANQKLFELCQGHDSFSCTHLLNNLNDLAQEKQMAVFKEGRQLCDAGDMNSCFYLGLHYTKTCEIAAH